MNTERTETGTQTGPILLTGFLSTVTMLFAAFTAAYLIRRNAADWHPVDLSWIPGATTVVLLISSFTMEVARRTASLRWLAVTGLLGLLFVGGQVQMWNDLVDRGFFLRTTPHASFVYLLTAVHGVHLLGGIAALPYAMVHRSALGLCAIYWHFMDLVWIYLFAVLSFL